MPQSYHYYKVYFRYVDDKGKVRRKHVTLDKVERR